MSAIKVGIVALVVGALGSVAVIVTPSWFPVQASTQAVRQDDIYLALMIMSSFIFAIVVVFLVYSLWKFRARPGDEDRDGPPVHGHTVLEVVWTLIPTLIVVGFAVAGGIILNRNETLAADHLTVNVTGQQFEWTFRYPGTKVESGYLELPVGRQVEFRITAPPNDVIHEFYIPAFRVGEDAVPGHATTLIATPTRVGTYVVECLELCGIGHSQMRSIVNVVPPAKFRAWLAQQQRLATQPPPSSGPVDAKATFTQTCGSCHTFTAAGTTGSVGPNLDNLTADAAKYGNGESEAQYVHDSIVDPGKVVVSGYPNGIMPTNFSTQLSAAQIAALVTLLTKGGS
ncbi:MAG: cytochrome c oxidase subunit II [Gaiellales bacterium]